jgi:hypothetical protein
MDDDFRLQIDLDDKGIAGQLADHLRASEIQGELAADLNEKMIVSNEGQVTYVYAATREPLDWVQGVIEKFAREKDWNVTMDLRRWHHESEQWEDPGAPLPATEAEKEAEHEALIETEAEETAERGGRAEFEVKVEFPSHREAHDFAEKLAAEGLEPVRRWRYLVVGAADEDAAQELASRIREEAPSDGKVTVEYSLNELWRKQPANPFFFLGGLAG